jgi:hypothetical protein
MDFTKSIFSSLGLGKRSRRRGAEQEGRRIGAEADDRPLASVLAPFAIGMVGAAGADFSWDAIG